MDAKHRSINLKENLYLSLTPPPKKSQRMITGALNFMSETETRRHVRGDDTGFWNYITGTWVQSAKHSLKSAIEKLIGREADVSNVKFHIYSLS
jgi:hypothetical protein